MKVYNKCYKSKGYGVQGPYGVIFLKRSYLTCNSSIDEVKERCGCIKCTADVKCIEDVNKESSKILVMYQYDKKSEVKESYSFPEDDITYNEGSSIPKLGIGIITLTIGLIITYNIFK